MESNIVMQRYKHNMLRERCVLFYTATINTIQRFPLAILLSVLLCVFKLIDQDSQRRSLLPAMILEKTAAYYSIGLCGFLLFIGLKLIAENHQLLLKYYYLIGAVLFFTMAQHLYTSEPLFVPACYIINGLFLSLLISPFLSNSSSGLAVWSFCYHFLLRLCIVSLVALMLITSGIFILFTIQYLFEVPFYALINLDLCTVVLTFVSPLFMLMGIPNKFDTSKIVKLPNINMILSYLIIPFLFIYMLILYVYIAKISATWTLPKGILAYLSSTFGYLGIITYLVSYPMHDQNNIILFFTKHFFKLLPIPLLVFAISIFVRIHNYGITESRYLLLLSLIWLVSSNAFILLKPMQQVPQFLIGSLSLLLLLASFGPWSAINVSAQSQTQRLSSLLEKNKISISGKINLSEKSISIKDKENITSIVTYLVKTNKTKLIKPWFLHCKKAHLNQERNFYQSKSILQDLGLEP